MRNDPDATLMIYCASCGNSYNEYNWTLETAAVYSEEDHTVPTLLDLLIRCLEGNTELLQTAYVVCPSCHEKIYLRKLKMPALEDVLEYAVKVGTEYRSHRY